MPPTEATSEGPDPIESELDLAQFLQAHHGELVSFCCKRGLDKHTAEDLTQEALLVLWRRRRDARPAPRAFVFGVLRRLLLAHHRRTSSSEEVSLEDLPDGLPDPNATATHPDNGAPDELRRAVAQALDQLSHAERQVVELVLLEGRGREHVAELLGITRGALRVRQKRAFDRLREPLSSLLDERGVIRGTRPPDGPCNGSDITT